MCLVPLECVCLLCKFGAFSEIIGIKISKFSRGSMPPDPSRNRSRLRRPRKGSSRLRCSLGQIAHKNTNRSYHYQHAYTSVSLRCSTLSTHQRPRRAVCVYKCSLHTIRPKVQVHPQRTRFWWECFPRCFRRVTSKSCLLCRRSRNASRHTQLAHSRMSRPSCPIKVH